MHGFVQGREAEGTTVGEDERMEKRASREKLLRYLERLAFYRPNDGIRIALEEGDLDVRRLRLEGVSEFRRHANGTVEVKFFDRLKALTLLMELQEEGEVPAGHGIRDFLEGLSGGEPG